MIPSDYIDEIKVHLKKELQDQQDLQELFLAIFLDLAANDVNLADSRLNNFLRDCDDHH